MRKTILILIIVVLIITTISLQTSLTTDAYKMPLEPLPTINTGNGTPLDVYEFITNQSETFYNVQNNTIFPYLVDWYPESYRGYHFHANLLNIRKTVNPVPNWNFEQYSEPENNWTLSTSGGGLVSSLSNTSGGNPGSCLDVELAYDRLLGSRTAEIENNFNYTSSIPPDSLTLYFDVRYSSDITNASWLIIQVRIETDSGSTVASWVTTTDDFAPKVWVTQAIASVPVNGSLTVKIKVTKQTSSMLEVNGHIYFDNFNYQIGSYSAPSEVSLSLNDTAVVDTFANYGEVDIYADSYLKEKINFDNAWNTTQWFIFNSTEPISFDFKYTMAMKTVNSGATQTGYSIQENAAPYWTVNYTIPSGRPPPGFSNESYQYGISLPQGWQLNYVRDSQGYPLLRDIDFTWNSSCCFFLLRKGIAEEGDMFTIYAQSNNFVTEVILQKSVSSNGPWETVTSEDFFVTGEYVRVIGTLEPINSTGNTGTISIILPNGTVCNTDAAPIFDSYSNTLTSAIWQFTSINEEFAGREFIAQISYSSGIQCGLRTQTFSILKEAEIIIYTPLPSSEMGWFDFPIIVYIQDSITEEYIIGAEVRLRYNNPQDQSQSVIMSLNDEGAYTTVFSPQGFEPEAVLTFEVEFFKFGYVNATIAEGTAEQFNLHVNTGLQPIHQVIVYSVLLAIVIFSVWLLYSQGYRKRYLIPKRKAHEKTLQEVLAIYNDVTNLSRVLVLHRGSGIAIFDFMGEKGLDGSLIGGFLQALQAFSLDLNEGRRKGESARLSEITYEGFRVLINDGEHVRTALVYRGIPSEALFSKLKLFTEIFEEQYQHQLSSHKDETGRFQKANELLEEIFHISLLFPHKVEPKTADIKLSNLESRLHFVALEISKEKESIHLSEILKQYLETVQDDPVELLNGIFQLREKNLLIPIEPNPSVKSKL